MKTLRTLAVFAVFAAFGAAAPVIGAELQLPKDLPPYGADKPVPVPKIDKQTLANGMTLWIVADAEGAPKANFVLAVRGGAAHDPRAQNGLSSILAGTIDEGTKSRSPPLGRRQAASSPAKQASSTVPWSRSPRAVRCRRSLSLQVFPNAIRFKDCQRSFYSH